MMDRSRDARRVNMAASNGLLRRRHRTGSTSLRDSPEDEGPVDVHEAAGGRLRDRAVVRKKDRDRERDRTAMMMMSGGGSSRSKRRRAERLMVHHNHAGAGHHHLAVDGSSDESLNEDEDEDEGGSLRMLPPNNSTHNQNHSSSVFTTSSSSSVPFPNHHHHLNHHRKSFPPQPPPHPPPILQTSVSVPVGSKMFRSSTPATAPPWASDEVIGVSVPRKARSASTKRSHESWTLSGCGALVGSDLIHRQASTSPARSSGPGAPGCLVASASASPAPAPVSPSSSYASAKKKLKANGQKQKPPKSSSNKSAAQDEIEIEIAEVLYGMMRQPQGPSAAVAKPETSLAGSDSSLKLDFREVSNSKQLAGDSKSRVSSPVSNSPSESGLPAQSFLLSNPANSSSASGASPMSATAPKRKRPRPVKYEEENPTMFPVRRSPIPTSTANVDADQLVKTETCSPNLEKTLEFVPATQATGGVSPPSGELHLDAVEKPQASDSKVPLTKEPEARETLVGVKKEEPRSPNPVPKLDFSKSSSAVYEAETLRRDKFEIDLMAPPARPSPERDSEIDFVAVGPKPMVTNVETDLKPPHVVNKEDDDKVAGKVGKVDIIFERDEKRAKVMGEEVESQKPGIPKERNINLQLDLAKTERDGESISGNVTSLQQNVQKQQQQQQPTGSEKSVGAPTSSLHLPMSMAGWPGGLPHMGYMTPLQGVVSVEGNALPSATMQPPHLQRPRRCATHCYIARNIHYHQQLSRMNPFWPAGGGSGLAPYGAKMNVLPSTGLHTGRGVNPVQEKGQSTAIFPGPSGKDKNSPVANVADAAQRKQILVQQSLPPGGPSNILHSPAFIFPLSQQHAVAAASVRPGTVKTTPPAAGGASSSSSSSSSTIGAAATTVPGATAMNFNYPNMAGSEPYLAILQNGAYPIPIPAHVGTNPAYRGAHPQAMPFFNGSFYSSQMLHPSQLQQQQQQLPATQIQQSHRGPPNPIVSSGSSSSQKQLLNQQQKSHGSSINCGGAKNQSSQSLQFQQRQQPPNPNAPHPVRQQEGEIGSEDSPSAIASRANTNIYGQNFVVPIHPPNFAFMNPAAIAGASGLSGNPSEKKQQHSQQQSSRAGVDSLPSQAFAMSFASMNGAAAAQGFDISSITQNPALLQSLPEAARHSYHFVAAANAQAQQHKKSYRATDEGKTGGSDSSNIEEDRKTMMGGKVPANAGQQSIAFSRPDLIDASVSSMTGNNVIDSSARTLNLGSTPGRLSGSVIPPAVSNVNAPGVQQQLHRAQQQQVIQRAQQQQQFTVSTSASARNKNSTTSNGSVYSDHVSSSPSSVAAKVPNALSGFPQSVVQNIGSHAQSQWKNSMRTTISQVPSPSSHPSNASALKNLPQQQSRAQHSHTQISFGANPKPTVAPQGHLNPSSNQSPSSPMVGGSPTASNSKSAGGSPRTTSTSASNKGGPNPTSQQVKNSGPMPPQKSSPVGGRNAPSILGHPHSGASNPSSAPKPQQLTQQQQQQLSKLAHSQMMYAGAYMQSHASQAPHGTSSTNNSTGASEFYLQRHRNEQQPLPQSQGPSMTSSTGILTLCTPVTLNNACTTDPAKAAGAASSMKGGASPYVQFAAAQSSGKPHQLVTAGFPYVPAAVQVKQADQKQPDGE